MSQSSAGGVPERRDEMQTLISSLSDQYLAALSTSQTGFVISMRIVNPDLSGYNLRDTVAEMFPPDHLFV